MFNRKSIYALNKKDPNAIVYLDAEGNLIRLTRDDFKSEKEFLRWKTWSDENFRTEDNSDVAEDRHNISLNSLSEESLAIPSVEDVMENYYVQAEKHRKAVGKVIQLKKILTEKQFRRIWMYIVDGKTEQQIAAIEGSAQQQISKSIKAAKKKTEKLSAKSKNRV